MDFPRGWQEFVRLCSTSIAADNFDELCNVLLTVEEKNQLATRVLLLQQLLMGAKSQREIAQCFNISIAKITRGSNELKRGNMAIIDFLRSNLVDQH